MRIALNVVGGLCVLVGCVWILQGVGVLPGSFMSGQPRWAVFGAGLLVIGIVVLVRLRRRA